MQFDFQNLDSTTRELMLNEFNLDIEEDKIYFSKRFSENGHELYPKLMLKAIEEGNETTLSRELRNNNCFNQSEATKSGLKKIPINAPETFAEGEFNRYYIRALCLRAIEEDLSIQVYRAKEVSEPRYESIQMIGKMVDPVKILSDLRIKIGKNTVSGLPGGPNSGLSVKLVHK